jgi:hypothetical protein
MKKIVMSFAIVIVLLACNSKTESENSSKLSEEVMAVHDEIMPKMSEIMDLKTQLSDSLKAVDSTSVQFPIIKQQTDSLNRLLDAADNAMMDWMNQYKPDTLETISAEEGSKYLTDQKNKIMAVRDITLKNLAPVKQFLNKK